VHDIVIRGGTLVDGTGADRRSADVAVDGGLVAEVGRVADRGHREIDADGRLVLPGWVDVHTHFDGQATWDPELAPSSWHGVTTAVFGNCSVGFAPLRPGREDFLINLMEGVEDIPGTVLSEGMDFCWESFPEYLDVLERTPHAIDIGAQVPHGALRVYVMGERGGDHAERPGDDEIARMGELAVEALRAGAFGFTTSRTNKHRAADGRFTPSLTAAANELLGVARAMGEAGVGVLQINSDLANDDELELVRRMAEVSGRPLSFTLLQSDDRPGRWRESLDMAEAANAAGLVIRPQVASRPIGVLLGLGTTLDPLLAFPSYRPYAKLPEAERLARLRDPEVRQAILGEAENGAGRGIVAAMLDKVFPLGQRPDYEPGPERSMTALAGAAGRSPWSLVYDLLVEGDGRALLYLPFENYSDGDLEPVREMLSSPCSISGLSDAGAHVATICDASFPTSLLTHWTRDRTRGELLPLEYVVHKQTGASAAALGLLDRGVVAPGYRADLNVVDPEALDIELPELVHDLPAGGRRFVQRARGYRHTFVAGTEVMADGTWTGATPGRLVRGPQPAPAA